MPCEPRIVSGCTRYAQDQRWIYQFDNTSEMEKRAAEGRLGEESNSVSRDSTGTAPPRG